MLDVSNSAKYRLPAASTAISLGPLIDTAVATLPSDAYPATPFPATVVIVPVAASILRILGKAASAMYRLPAASTAVPEGPFISAAVAEPPSPVYPAVPLPAYVVMVPGVIAT